MDKTEIYIKMADCPEIQNKKRKFKSGDVLYEKKHSEIVTIGDFVDIEKQYSDDKFTLSTGHYDYDWFKYERKEYTWLPTQDQIQEMMGANDLHGQECVFMEFAEGFDLPDYLFDFDSLEKLWLALYMALEHVKIWDGKEWQKQK